MSDVQETTRTLYTCEMRGGPQDGCRHTFDVLPIMLYTKNPFLGFYELTDTVAADGARVFEYHAPQP